MIIIKDFFRYIRNKFVMPKIKFLSPMCQNEYSLIRHHKNVYNYEINIPNSIIYLRNHNLRKLRAMEFVTEF